MRKIVSFTLIELLVVIGIITILITVGTASYTVAQKKSRDVKRKGDLKAIQNAFEQYYSINNFQYPISGASVPLSGDLTSNNSVIITYPEDPTSGYYQCTDCTLNSYKICASLESDTALTSCVNNQQ